MTSVRIFVAILAFSVAVCGVSSAVLAGPQDYCVAYAGQFANVKMGISADHLVGILGGSVQAAGPREGDVVTDEKWQGAYNKALSACMENYESQPVTAAIDPPDTSKANLGSKRQKAKASHSPSKATERKRGTKSERTSAASRALKSESQELQPRTVAPAAHDESLCRRVRVSKGGAYHIENCGRARSGKNRATRR